MPRRRVRIVIGLVIAILTSWVQDANAFDGHRKGLFLSVGVGPGFLHSEHSNYRWIGSRQVPEDGSSISSSFRIGAGASDILVIYWSALTHFAQDMHTKGISSAGLGIRYYVQSTAPTFYGSVVYGYENWRGRWDTSHTGPGGTISAGYEFLKNYELEAGLQVGSESGIDFRVIALGINRAWY